jgi:hypothetical protein
LELSRRILWLLVRTFVDMGGPLTFVIDETVERRGGGCMRKRGPSRDPLASSTHRSVATSGLRWIGLTLVITPPWAQRPWALPVLSVPAPTPEVSPRLGLRQKTGPQRARQMRLVGRRWLPGVELTVIGDQTYSVHELGGACARRGIRLVAPLRLDAAWYEPVPPRTPGTNGRPRVKGERLPQLTQVLKEAQTPWQRIRVRWYNGRRRELDVTSGTAVWSRIGQPVLPIRWVLVRAPKGRLAPRASFSPWTHDRPRPVVQQCSQRWSIETTFEESRAHLGLETQRQWSDRAIERTTPRLLGLYSVVAVLAPALSPDGKVPVQRAAWYPKNHATCADVWATIRHHGWSDVGYSTSADAPDLVAIPRSELSRLVQVACYTH